MATRRISGNISMAMGSGDPLILGPFPVDFILEGVLVSGIPPTAAIKAVIGVSNSTGNNASYFTASGGSVVSSGQSTDQDGFVFLPIWHKVEADLRYLRVELVTSATVEVGIWAALRFPWQAAKKEGSGFKPGALRF